MIDAMRAGRCRTLDHGRLSWSGQPWAVTGESARPAPQPPAPEPSGTRSL